MSGWRPGGWKLPWTSYSESTQHTYEAGADAMLAALKEGGGSEYYPPEEGRPQSGWVVFIPDGEK